MDKRKQVYFAIVSLSLSFLVMDAWWAVKGDAAGPWVSAPGVPLENPGAKVQEFQNRILELKNQRDSAISALIKERDTKIQALLDGLKQTMQEDAAQFQKDKENIQQQMRQGLDMTKAQTLLEQEEQALSQKYLVMQQQVNSVKSIYDQQISNLTEAYAQQFAILQQQFSTGK